MKMQNKILSDDKAVCMLVEVIAKHSQMKNWAISIDGKSFSHNRIQRLSLDKFYGVVFGDDTAFSRLCKALPTILDDVVKSDNSVKLVNTVYTEMGDKDFYRSLYLLAFKTYDGFEQF